MTVVTLAHAVEGLSGGTPVSLETFDPVTFDERKAVSHQGDFADSPGQGIRVPSRVKSATVLPRFHQTGSGGHNSPSLHSIAENSGESSLPLSFRLAP